MTEPASVPSDEESERYDEVARRIYEFNRNGEWNSDQHWTTQVAKIIEEEFPVSPAPASEELERLRGLVKSAEQACRDGQMYLECDTPIRRDIFLDSNCNLRDELDAMHQARRALATPSPTGEKGTG